LLIQVSSRPGRAVAQASTTASKALSMRTSNGSRPDRAGQPARDVHAVQRQHAPALGVDQEDALVVASVRHGKDAALVAGDEIIDREGVVIHGVSQNKLSPAP
jgi:hypothetical protein